MEKGSADRLARRPVFHVVLHEPEIPQNTGNIGRTCVATHCALHLIEPLGFETTEKACRRAGLDYWPRLMPRQHGSFEEYVRGMGLGLGGGARESGEARVWGFTTKRGRTIYEAEFRAGDHMVFGKETSGLPGEILEALEPNLVTFPMGAGERSLNVATAVCAAIYVGLGELIRRGEVGLTGENRLRVRE